MLKNYWKIAWRTLWKNKLVSAINLGGLAVGIASSILLLSYVSFQFSYDNFHPRKQDIYRVNLDFYQNNLLTLQSAENYSAVGPALKKDFPEILDQARLYNMGYKNNCVFSYKNTQFPGRLNFYIAIRLFSRCSLFPSCRAIPVRHWFSPIQRSFRNRRRASCLESRTLRMLWGNQF